MNFGISTAWQSGQLDDGHALLDSIAATGLRGLEIDYRVTGAMLKQMLPRLHSSEFQVLTVHNYCPLPPGYTKADAVSILNLASLDEEERKTAVKYGKKSLQWAADLGAKLVVFHFGKIDMHYDAEELFAFYHQGQLQSSTFHTWLQQKFAERANLAQNHLPRLLRSIDTLHAEAFRLGVLMGAENRYRFTQMPFGDEFDALFNEFAGGQLRYWHDLGHAEIYHRLQILDHEKDFLARWQPHLEGFHLHDVLDLQDHLAPGTGDFDFDLLKPYIKPDMIRIFEIHSMADAGQIKQGVSLLQQKGLL